MITNCLLQLLPRLRWLQLPGTPALTRRQQEMAMTGKNRIMIYGPKNDGAYVVQFRTAAGETLAISIPRTEAAVIRHFQERMPYGLFVPDVNAI